MPLETRTFRVFVSSTFEDLKEERDALQREVFPKLRTLCEQHGARFQAIDLRWGVREEAALDQKTMEICLSEIRRCQATGIRPNFIALLGDRYGWRPLPLTIQATEFEALMPYILPHDARALADRWYRLDENAVPAEYCLQPRSGVFVEGPGWNLVESSLLNALATAARAAGLSGNALVKYEASATHQEILAGLAGTEEGRQHVFGFVRRSIGNTDPRLEALKSQLRVYEFGAGDMEGLCKIVLSQLTKVIEAEVKRFEDRPALDLEVEAHDRFADERCRIFTGRQAVLDTIADYLHGPDRRALVLHGESGSGKSAVMAKASEQWKGPGRVIRRFIGASSESASGHALLTSLCREIAPGETPVDYAQLENAFRERLALATAEQTLVLIVDALDQLAVGDPARESTWLPSELPPYVKVIVSATDEEQRLPEGVHVRLERMEQSEGAQALDALLREAHRTLQPWQRNRVLLHFERCGLPLYLKLAAEESKLWKSYTPPDACKLGEGLAGVIDTLFSRLASNANHGPVLVERSMGYLAAARYGLAEDEILDLLTADDAIRADFDKRKYHDVGERRLPVAVWSRLSLDLEPYLAERATPGGTVIGFYHRQLVERVEKRFLVGDDLRARHSGLAHYFLARPARDTRRAVELVFQQRSAHQWSEAEATLFDSQFLFAKVDASFVLDLDADYQALLKDAPESELPRRESLRLIQGALQLSMHVVSKYPAQFPSQMVARLLTHRDNPGASSFVDEIAAAAPRPWFRPLHPGLDAPGGRLLRTLAGHSGWVIAVAITPDGRQAVSASGDKTLKVWDLASGEEVRTLAGHDGPVNALAITPDGRQVVSGSWDGALKVWDLASGEQLKTLAPYNNWVNALAITPDSLRLVSAYRALAVWDLGASQKLSTLAGHDGPVTAVAITPDGRQVVSASADTTLKVWELASGKEVRTLAGHRDGVLAAAITPDGCQLVSTSSDGTLKVWELASGKEARTLVPKELRTFRPGWVGAVAITPDGRQAVSALGNMTLKVWDLASGDEVRTLSQLGGWVFALAITPNGRLAVSASDRGTLKVWGLPSWRDLGTLGGHRVSVRGVAITPDSGQAVSASEDKTLKVWDLETGALVTTFTCDTAACCCAFSGTRRIVVGDSGGRVHFLSLELKEDN